VHAHKAADRAVDVLELVLRSSNRVRSGTLCRCSSSDAPGLNSPRPG